MTLVRSRTSIPVPVVHFFENSPSNEVGMQFLVTDYAEGVKPYRIWDDLTLEHKKDVLTQIAWVLGQLANMEFKATGSITEDGSIGPLLHHMMENGEEVGHRWNSICYSCFDGHGDRELVRKRRHLQHF